MQGKSKRESEILAKRHNSLSKCPSPAYRGSLLSKRSSRKSSAIRLNKNLSMLVHKDYDRLSTSFRNRSSRGSDAGISKRDVLELQLKKLQGLFPSNENLKKQFNKLL